MEKYAVIVAGGEGKRYGASLPKQFLEIEGRPLLWWSMKAFHDEDPEVKLRLVLHPGFFDDWDLLFNSLPEGDRIHHEVICGGRSRTESVKNGIMSIPDSADVLIAVHDAARPAVTPDLIRRGWESALVTGGAVPVLSVTDSLREIEADGSKAVDRSRYVVVQTPQVFRADLLKAAYSMNQDAVFSDDATAFEASGLKVSLFEGLAHNIKVTNPGDLEIAALFLNRRQD